LFHGGKNLLAVHGDGIAHRDTAVDTKLDDQLRPVARYEAVRANSLPVFPFLRTVCSLSLSSTSLRRELSSLRMARPPIVVIKRVAVLHERPGRILLACNVAVIDESL
jgi:hypothetical protein